MYKCLGCKKIFEEPEIVSCESFYGVSSEFNYMSGKYFSICPFCGGAIEDYIEEKEIEEYIEEDIEEENEEE